MRAPSTRVGEVAPAARDDVRLEGAAARSGWARRARRSGPRHRARDVGHRRPPLRRPGVSRRVGSAPGGATSAVGIGRGKTATTTSSAAAAAPSGCTPNRRSTSSRARRSTESGTRLVPRSSRRSTWLCTAVTRAAKPTASSGSSPGSARAQVLVEQALVAEHRDDLALAQRRHLAHDRVPAAGELGIGGEVPEDAARMPRTRPPTDCRAAARATSRSSVEQQLVVGEDDVVLAAELPEERASARRPRPARSARPRSPRTPASANSSSAAATTARARGGGGWRCRSCR